MGYHRLYDIANITVISNKNTVGVYDMESEVKVALKRGVAVLSGQRTPAKYQ